MNCNEFWRPKFPQFHDGFVLKKLFRTVGGGPIEFLFGILEESAREAEMNFNSLAGISYEKPSSIYCMFLALS